MVAETNFRTQLFLSRPWLDHNGLQDTTIIMAMICLVANMSFLLLIWKGKRLREWTAKRYTILMQQKDKEDLII